jgi:hypothetical protein
MSKISSVLLCCHENVFANIRCRGNNCLPSCCLANGHIPSQYNLQLMQQPQITHVKDIIIVQVREFVLPYLAAESNCRASRQGKQLL